MSKSSHKGGKNVARLALLVAGGLSTAGAKDAHTNLQVSVNVLAVAHLEIESTPKDIELTDADLARGFVEVAQPTQLVVRSNSAQGYALEVTPLTRMASAILVSGLDSAQRLGAEGGTVVQRWHSPRPVHLALQYRFELAPGLPAGRYPWPIHLTVRPLETI